MKIAVLLSGGVDSAVSLVLLKQQGYDVEAFYLKIWLEQDGEFMHHCPWQEDVRYVSDVCRLLGVRFSVIPMQQQYYHSIIDYTVTQARAGNTPNPDVLCNTFIKFGAFLDVIDDSYDRVATGHYAQRVDRDGYVILRVSPDLIKDQTYFLSYLSQQQLGKTMFPIGSYTKSHVRALAETFQLPNALRKDSQGLCFLGKIKFKDFLKRHLGIASGKFIDFQTGAVMGQHEGAWFYTIGQRQGMGLAGGPWYVVAKDIASHAVFISREPQGLLSVQRSFMTTDCRWNPLAVLRDGMYKLKVRHGPAYHDAFLTFCDDKKNVLVKLSMADQGIAAGQFAVFYRDDLCVGAGIIQLMDHSLNDRLFNNAKNR